MARPSAVAGPGRRWTDPDQPQLARQARRGSARRTAAATRTRHLAPPQRAAPSRRAASADREQRQRVLGEHGQRRHRPAPRPGRSARDAPVAGRATSARSAMTATFASPSASTKSRSASAFLRTESTSVQRHLGPRQGQRDPGHAAAGAEVQRRAGRQLRRAAAGRPAQSSRCRRATSSGSTTRVRFSRAVAGEQQRDVALGAHRAKPGGRVPRCGPSARAARSSARRAARASVWDRDKENAPPVAFQSSRSDDRLAAGFRIGPDACPVTVLGRRGSRTMTIPAAGVWTTSRVIHHSAQSGRTVDKSPGYTRRRWRPDLSGQVRSRISGGDADHRTRHPASLTRARRSWRGSSTSTVSHGATNPTSSPSPGTPTARSSSRSRRTSICPRSTSTWS